jgi:hypothetical protein
MEVYREPGSGAQKIMEDDEILEFDLEEEELEIAQNFLAIVVYYSHKSFSVQYLLTDMFHAWGIASLPQIENLEDCNFKLEFNNKEEKQRVLNRDPWRHKGDSLIVVHYDGLERPSKVRIESIALWVRLYDLPPVMMKEAIARQLGGQVGNFIEMDVRYLGYMSVRVDFPLSKALVPRLKSKIKGNGITATDVRYENVPHFCFTCGRLGHAA